MLFSRRAALAAPIGEIVTTFDYDAAEDQHVIGYTQDVEPYLEHNQRLYNSGHDGTNADGSLREIAEIPPIIIHQWMLEGISIFRKEDWPKIRQRLNDPEWRKLRTAPGRV